eukprot:2499938-Alexandrium_andersonii.AAC.1
MLTASLQRCSERESATPPTARRECCDRDLVIIVLRHSANACSMLWTLQQGCSENVTSFDSRVLRHSAKAAACCETLRQGRSEHRGL